MCFIHHTLNISLKINLNTDCQDSISSREMVVLIIFCTYWSCICQLLFLFSLGLKLTGEFLGQTKTKVDEALNKARGGVLFIDEAYSLGMSQYGKEAVDSLVTIYKINYYEK